MPKLDAAVVTDLNSRRYLHAMLTSLGHLQILAQRSATSKLSSAKKKPPPLS